ncbi:PAS domain-containing protein [Sphingomonas mollis]|uniref:PAS domain-containing protein n=1 Tax=Sphingomonas mollis TaxID=2795726 RepID=A0ABS0XTM0_9SPHN|nr:PAS domain-containing protein [Sphingomonas sp. BT553]MBJ6123399.1 PAS domain-containing protein [Sphingomonas sp. BT553]
MSVLVGHSVSDADGRILTMDQSLCDLLQRSAAELVGMSYADLTHPDDVVRNVADVESLRVCGGPVLVRKRYVRADSSTVWCDVHVSRFASPDGGRLIGTIHLVNPGAVDRGPESLWRAARRVGDLMIQRRIEFGSDLFADQAWSILLDTYLAEAEGRLISIAEIGHSLESTGPLTERWIKALESRGWIERTIWDLGAIQLTADGLTRIERLLASQVV